MESYIYKFLASKYFLFFCRDLVKILIKDAQVIYQAELGGLERTTLVAERPAQELYSQYFNTVIKYHSDASNDGFNIIISYRKFIVLIEEGIKDGYIPLARKPGESTLTYIVDLNLRNYPNLTYPNHFEM